MSSAGKLYVHSIIVVSRYVSPRGSFTGILHFTTAGWDIFIFKGNRK